MQSNSSPRPVRILHHAIRFTWSVFWLSLAALAFVLSAARLWLLPEVETWRAELEQRAAQIIGLPVRIQAIRAHMQGFTPELVLAHTVITSADGVDEKASLGDVHLRLDPVKWLRDRNFAPRSIALHGATLRLSRTQDGRVLLDELVLDTSSAGALSGLDLFELIDSRLDWQDATVVTPSFHLDVEHLSLLEQDGERHIHLIARPDATRPGIFTLLARLKSRPLSDAHLDGSVYVRGRDLDLPQALNIPRFPDAHLRAGEADFELWSGLNDGRLAWVGGHLALDHPTLRGHHEGEDRHLFLERMDGWFRWRAEDTGGRLEIHHLQLARDERTWPMTRATLELRETPAGSAWRVASSWLDAADLTAIAHTLRTFDGTALAGADFSGTLHDLALSYDPTATEDLRINACLSAEALSWRVPGRPAGEGFRGAVCGTGAAGMLTLNSQAARLNWPEVFPTTLEPLTLRGDVHWSRSAQGVRVETTALSAKLADATLSGRFAWDEPAQATGSPSLEADIQIEDSNPNALLPLLPHSVPPATRAWLQQAFTAGRIQHGRLELRGAPGKFPFHQGGGHFTGQLALREAVLRFHPRWQPIESLDADLTFRADHIHIDAQRAALNGAPLGALKADITRIAEPGAATLALDGALEAPLPRILGFFAQSPFRDITDRLTRHAVVEGAGALDLHIDANLARDIQDVQGRLSLRDARIVLAGGAAPIEHINGLIAFSPGHLSAEQATAQLGETPVTLSLARNLDQARVKLTGSTPWNTIEARFPALAGAGLSGTVPFHLGVDIPWSRAAHTARVFVESDLNGLAVNLPEPLGKPRNTARSFVLEAHPGEDTERLPVRLAYGDALHARFTLSPAANGWTMRSGVLALGAGARLDEPEAGWALRGHLDRVSLSDWRAWWVKQSWPAHGLWPEEIDLAAAHPSWNGRDLGTARVKFHRQVHAWDGEIHAEALAGRVHIPSPDADDATWRLDLNHLRVPKVENETLEQARKQSPNPATLPAIALSSAHLFWNKLDLGHVSLHTRHQDNGLAIDTLEVRGAGLQADLNGHWHRLGEADESRIDGRIRADDLGAALEKAGLPREIRDTPARLEWTLRWPDAPHKASRALLEGEARLELGKGALAQFEPGLARALGLFNIRSLLRRLKLDFSDVLDEGFAYDRVHASFQISRGQAKTHDFTVKGASAGIRATGRVDLPGRNFDLLVTVAPHTSVVLPTIGTLAGGPVVGAAVLAAQALAGEKMEILTETQYSVTGPWQRPEIRRLSRLTPIGILQNAWESVQELSTPNPDPPPSQPSRSPDP